MDFKNLDLTSGPVMPDLNSDAAAVALDASATLAVALQAGNILPLTADGQLVLPAGVGLDDIKVVGRDLVIQMPDGTQMIVPDGAVFVPQIVVDGVAVPPLNIAALLIGQEPQPAAGRLQSSGGNFADAVGDIGDPFGLGDLLPPTQLAFPEPEEREIIPGLDNEKPTTIIVTPDQPAGSISATASVQEAALPPRDSEPAGSNETSNAETTTGSIVFETPDGLSSITLNGVAITAVGQVFVTPLGSLTITSIATGNIGYSYTLTDNTVNPALNDNFAVVVTDSDGDTALANLTINIVDDAPTARNDTDAIAAGTYGPQTGNVVTGAGTTSGASGADTAGADGAAVSGVRAGSEGSFGSVGSTINGQYGTLTLNSDGSYSYTRGPNTPGGVTDTFSYQITDGDGDTSTATLAISIGDSPAAITFVPSVGEGTIVSEVGLPETRANGNVESPGSNPELPVEATTGTITFLSPDGVASVSLGGTVITPGALPQQVFADATGTLVVTAYNYNPTTGIGSVTYSYTLTDNTENTNGTVVSFPIVVVDLDGDSSPPDTLDITIQDDAPQADDDFADLTEGGPSSVTVDVDANDVSGADGTGSRVFTSLTGTYGTITLNENGTQTYTLSATGQLAIDALAPGAELIETFEYTLTDGDGDAAPAKLLVTLTGTDDPVVITNLTPAANGGDVTVDEDDLAAGSDLTPEPLTQAGDFTISAPDGLNALTVGTVNVIVNGEYVGGSATTPLGNTLTFTGYNPETGVVSYTYTLSTAETHADGADENSLFENFTVTLTDLDGSATDSILSVNIVDDIPEAKADEDSVTEDDFSGERESVSADGNVLTGVGGSDVNDTDGVDDTEGADGATVTAVAFDATPGVEGGLVAGVVGGDTNGDYGRLLLNADGSYTYTLNNFDLAVQGLDGNDTLTEVFTYAITDGDGDPSETTLTITINGSDDPIMINGLNVQAPELIVDEDDLSDGSSPAPAALTQTGTFTVNGTDGIASIKIDATEIAVDQEIITANGTFKITSISAPVDGNATAITVGYSYVLTNNDAHPNADDENFLTEVFDIIVTDTDGSIDSDTIEVRIIDDVPTAAKDTDVVAGGSSAPATGNVITDTAPGDNLDLDDGADVQGADGASVISVASINVPANSDNTLNEAGNFVVNGEFGVLTIKPDGSYSYVRNDGSPGDRIDTFTYTIRDADGDTDNAILEITIEDDRPVVGENPDVVVDDDDLGGNPASTTGDDDPQNETGTLSGSGGDGVLTWAFQTNGAPAGFQYLASGSDILVQQDQGGSWITVATVTLDTTDGDYSVTQNNPVIHADGDNENNLSVTLNYTVKDVDLDSTPGTVTINFDDDAPTATAEPAQSVGEGGIINGIVDFIEGADGASVTRVNDTALIFGEGGFSQAIDIGDGSIRVKVDGTYVFTADNPVIGTGSANATFTITDGDKDIVTATAAFTITDVNQPTGGETLASLDDDGLKGGNADSDTNDLVVPNVDNDGSEATFAGTLTHNFGGDGAGTVSFAALDGTSGIVGTEPVDYSWSEAAGVGTLTATGPRGPVFTIEVTLSTGAYELTLNDNVLHADGPNQENAVDPTTALTYNVVDADGSPATGTLTITFDDDAPTLVVDGPVTVVEGESTVGGSWSQTIGADLEGAVTKVIFGDVEYDLDTAIDTGKGILTVAAGGTWVFAANDNLDNDLDPSVTFTVRVTDADGDVADDTQIVAIEDGPPADNADAIALDLNEAALGTPGATGSNPDLMAETDNTPSLSFTAGSDALTSFQFSENLGSLLSTLDGAGPDIFWVRAADGQSVVGHLGSAIGPVAVTLTLFAPISIAAGDTGSVTVTATLSDNLSHLNATADQIQSLGSILVEARDHDGDVATGQVTINVQDDVPTARADEDSIDEDQVSASGNVLSGAGTTNAPDSKDTTGADAAVVTGAVAGSVAGPVANGGLGGGLGGDYGTLTLDANGGYSYALDNTDPQVQALGVGDIPLEDIFTYTITDADGDKSTATLKIFINGTNDAPTFDAVVASVSEEGLTDGIPDTDFDPDDTTDDTTAGGSINLNDADLSDALTVTLGLPTGALQADGAAVEWTLSPDSKTLTGTVGVIDIIQISIDDTGNYSVNLLQAVDHLTANGENVSTFTVPVTVFDGTATVSNPTGITVRVEDDSPTVTAVAAGAVLVANDETATSSVTATINTGAIVIGNDPDVADAGYISTATSVGAVVTATPIYGADGAAATGSLSYALALIGSASGVTLTDGTAINLVQVGDVIVGQVAAGGSPFAGQAAFAIAISPTSGVVTVEQYLSLSHPTNPNNDETVQLLTGGVGVQVTVTDSDGDIAKSAVVDISAQVRFDDDGPTLTNVSGGGSVTLDETGGFDNLTSATAVINFTAAFGADGPKAGSDTAYTLELTPGGVSTLQTAVGNFAITLVQTAANVITGRYTDGTVKDAFTVTINTNGTVTVQQLVALEHNVDGFDAAAYDDALTLSGLITARVTITDGDNDATSETTEIGDQITFRDDGLNAVADTKSVGEGASVGGNVLVDAADTFGTDGAAFTSPAGGVVGVKAGSDTSAPVTTGTGVQIETSLGFLTLNANGSYSYESKDNSVAGTTAVTDTFVYTIADSDGDTSTTTLTITINPVTLIGADQTKTVNEAALDFVQDAADLLPGLATGSQPSLTTETVTGTLTATGGSGAVTYTAQTVNTAYGRFVLNTDGTYKYTLKSQFDGPTTDNGTVTHPAVEVFTYTVTDANGNTDTGTVTIDVIDDVPTARADTDSVTEDAVPNTAVGNVIDGVGTTNTPASIDTQGADGASVTGVIFGTSAIPVAGGVGGAGVAGTYGSLTLAAGGGYTYTLTNGNTTVQALGVGEFLLETFTYTITDGDGDTSTTTLQIRINGTNDAPTIGSATTAVSEEGFVSPATIGLPDTLGTTVGADTTNLRTASGTIIVGDVDGDALNVQLGFPTTTFTSGGVLVTWTLDGTGKVLTGKAGTTEVVVVTITNGGAYTVELKAAVNHADNVGTDAATLEDALSFVVPVSISDGTTTVNSVGGLTISIEDDSPVATSAAATSVINAAGQTSTASLDTLNGIVADSFGGDGAGKVIFTAATQTALLALNLTSGGATLSYTISGGGQILTAEKPDGTDVFIMTLQPTGLANSYTIQMLNPLDSFQNVVFDANVIDVVGGNGGWAGFVPNGQGTGSGDAPVDDNSSDLLVTPMVSGASTSTINTNANQIGVGGNFVNLNEGVRVDFVTDLTGSPVPGGAGDYGSSAANRAHVFDQHYLVNGASALFTNINSSSTVNMIARDDIGATDTLDTVGNGTIDNITKIAISFNAVTLLITEAMWNADVDKIFNVGGQNFTVDFDVANSNDVSVSGVISGTRLAAFTDSNYSSIEFKNTGGDDFKIGLFSAAKLTSAPVPFNVPISVVDRDGDTVTSGSIAVTATPAPPPVVLDLDSDGAELLAQSAGVTFDYAGDGNTESTAWVGADDGLLAIDSNGDGIVNDGSEIVFGGNGLTDLQGLAANYDSNHDGELTSADDSFALFGVWQDANSNGVTDAGEFESLWDAGVVSVGLVSDGVAYSAANGDVAVAGQALFTKADGTSGIVADAAFATGAAQSAPTRSADQLRTSNLTSSIIAASLVGLAIEDSPVAASDGDGIKPGHVISKFDAAGDAFELAVSTELHSNIGQSAFEPVAEFAQRTSDVRSTLRAEEEAHTVENIDDAPTSQLSELLADSSEPQAEHDAGGSGLGFGGDNVMHNMLDMAAFAPAAVANDNATMPVPVEDAIRQAMPDMMVDRLIDAFSAEPGTPANDAGGTTDGTELLAGVLDQAIDTFHLAAMNSSDPLGSHQYDLSITNNG